MWDLATCYNMLQHASMCHYVSICANHIQNYLFPEFILTSSSWFHLTCLTLSNLKSRYFPPLKLCCFYPAPCHLQSCTPTWSPCQGIPVQRVLVPFESVQILSLKMLRKSKSSSELWRTVQNCAELRAFHAVHWFRLTTDVSGLRKWAELQPLTHLQVEPNQHLKQKESTKTMKIWETWKNIHKSTCI